MKILITGGAGFIGSHLAERCAQRGFDVTVVDDLSNGSRSQLPAGVKFIEDTIGSESLWKSLPSCDALIHLAAQSSVPASVKDPQADFKANVAPIGPLLNYVESKGIRFLLYSASAGTVYGNASQFPTPESAASSPLSPYAATKAFFESYLSAWANVQTGKKIFSNDPRQPNYFSWISLRLANVYGPRQTSKGESSVVPLFFDLMKAGKTPIIFGDGGKTRDYVFVDDVVDSFMKALDLLPKRLVNDAFNIGTGTETTDLDVFKSIRDHLQLSKIKEPNFQSVRAGEVTRSFVDVSKARRILGWQAQRVFKDGLAETLDHYARLGEFREV